VAAPTDLVPRWADVFVPFAPAQLPMELTAVLDPADALLEVTDSITSRPPRLAARSLNTHRRS